MLVTVTKVLITVVVVADLKMYQILGGNDHYHKIISTSNQVCVIGYLLVYMKKL